MFVIIPLSLLLLAAAVGPAMAQEQEYDVTFPLAETAELNMQMQQGSSIVWRVETTGGEEIYMDLHSHVEGQVEYHARAHSTSEETGELTAPSQGPYSILVQNLQDDDVEVRLQVRGEFEVESENNIEPSGEANGSPGPGIGLLVVVVAALAAFARRR